MPLDDASWQAAYLRLERPLYNLLYRWLWHRQDCEDLMHEAFLRVWDKRYEVDASRVDALVFSTALNLARNRLRWRNVWRWTSFESDFAAGDDAQISAEHAERESRLRVALSMLPAGQRNVVMLAEFAGLSTREIASVLNIPEGTVGSRRNTAVTALRQHFGESFDA